MSRRVFKSGVCDRLTKKNTKKKVTVAAKAKLLFVCVCVIVTDLTLAKEKKKKRIFRQNNFTDKKNCASSTRRCEWV